MRLPANNSGMEAIQDLSRRVVGWKAGDILCNTQGDVCAFVRGHEVFSFCQHHLGQYDQGLFRTMAGDLVGTTLPASMSSRPRQRRRRFQITPWLQFSLPAPQPKMTFRTWAIWDRAINTLST